MPNTDKIDFKDLWKYVIDKNNNRKVLMIYAEAGMGKSRLLRNLVYKLLLNSSKTKYNNEGPKTLPLVVDGIYYTEFRNYKSIDEITSEIKERKNREEINYIILDGFDECHEFFTKASSNEILKKFFKILDNDNIIDGVSKIIISSRADIFYHEKSAFLSLCIEKLKNGVWEDEPIDVIKIDYFTTEQIIDRYKAARKLDKSQKKPNIVKKLQDHLSNESESILKIPFFITYADDLFDSIEGTFVKSLEEGLCKIVESCINKEYHNLRKADQSLEKDAYSVEMVSVHGKIAYTMYKNRLSFLLSDEYNSIPCKYQTPKERLLIVREFGEPQDRFRFQHKFFYEYFLVHHAFNDELEMSLKDRRQLLGLYSDTAERYASINVSFAKNLYACFLEQEKWEAVKQNVKLISFNDAQKQALKLLEAESITISDDPIWNIDCIILLLPFVQSLSYRNFKINNINGLIDYVDDRFLEINNEALNDSSGAERFGRLTVLDTTAGKIKLSELEHYTEVNEIRVTIEETSDLDNLTNLMNKKSINKCGLLLKRFKYVLLPELVTKIVNENLKQPRFSLCNTISMELASKALNTMKIDNSGLLFAFDKKAATNDFLFIEGLYFIESYYSDFINGDTNAVLFLLRTIIYKNTRFFYEFTYDLYQKRSKIYGKNHPFAISALYFFVQTHIHLKGNEKFNELLNVEQQYVNENLREFFLLQEAAFLTLLRVYKIGSDKYTDIYEQLPILTICKRYLLEVKSIEIENHLLREKSDELLAYHNTFNDSSDISNSPIYDIALYITGLVYSSMVKFDGNLETAIDYYEKVKTQGDALVQYHLGNFYEYGKGIEQNYEKAVELYQKAAKQNFSVAQYHVGDFYEYGKGVEQSYKKAIEWYQKAAVQNFSVAQYCLGDFYEYGKGVEQNYEKAVEWYQKAAEQNYDLAQYHLGRCYEYGKGVGQNYEKAVEWYQKAAVQNFSAAQYDLGCCYEYGKGVEQNYEKAVEWYQKAAEQNFSVAQYDLGRCYEYGKGVEQNYEKAVEWYQKAAEQNSSAAQYDLGRCYEYGEGVEQDYEKAFEWYKKAAEQGNAAAQSNLGSCYEYGKGVKQDYKKAVEWYQKAAEQGNAAAQYRLGSYYEYGKGVKQNYGKAVEWYKKAAEQGNAAAQYRLGSCYEYGNGVEQTYEKAVEWYQKAAEQNFSVAQYDLGRCYEYGKGVEQTYEKAVEWYQKTAEQDFSVAQYYLGRCYEYGNGVEQTYEKAFEWYQKAAEQDFSVAQYDLGRCYEYGKGVEQNYEKAVEWYQKAAKQGHKEAMRAKEDIEKGILPPCS